MAAWGSNSNALRSAPITQPNTAVADPSGRLLFAPDPGQTGTPYADFSFRAEDDFLGSTTAPARLKAHRP